MRPVPPGCVLIVCTGRDDREVRPHEEKKRVVPPLQAVDVGAEVLEFKWAEGDPVTGMTDDDRMQTFDFWCGTCRLRPKPNQRQLSRVVKGIAGADRSPTALIYCEIAGGAWSPSYPLVFWHLEARSAWTTRQSGSVSSASYGLARL
jgi:hypothetical protein